MSIRKANIIKIIVCVILACVLLAGNIVMSYAQETEVTNPYNLEYWTDAEESEYWEDLFPLFVLDQIGLISTHDLLESAYDNFVDIVDGLSVDANISYDDWIGAHFYLNPKDGVNTEEQLPNDLTVSYYTVDETMVNVVNQAVQETLAENPLPYVDIVIPSYKMLDVSSAWNNKGQYDTVKEFMSQGDGYYIGYNNNYQNKVSKTFLIYVPNVNIGLIGQTTGGIISSGFGISYNWNFIQSYNTLKSIPNVNQYEILANGTITGNTVQQIGNISTTKNITKLPDTNSPYAIFTSSDTNQHVFLFTSNDAYKRYNSGSPQPYYYGSEGLQYPSGNVSSSSVNTSSVADAYNQVTNNITSGMSGQEVINLVDTILNHYNSSSGGSGGSGSGGGHVIDFSSISALLASIGNLIGSLITGLAEGLTNIVNAINNVITSIRENLTQGIIFEWLTELIAWLPVEIRTLVIALFTLTVIFACIKLVKGIL